MLFKLICNTHLYIYIYSCMYPKIIVKTFGIFHKLFLKGYIRKNIFIHKNNFYYIYTFWCCQKSKLVASAETGKYWQSSLLYPSTVNKYPWPKKIPIQEISMKWPESTKNSSQRQSGHRVLINLVTFKVEKDLKPLSCIYKYSGSIEICMFTHELGKR